MIKITTPLKIIPALEILLKMFSKLLALLNFFGTINPPILYILAGNHVARPGNTMSKMKIVTVIATA